MSGKDRVQLFRKAARFYLLKARIFATRDLRISIGASSIRQSGWITTEQDDLDLLKPQIWRRLLGRRLIRKMVAEHVWEHLTREEALTAAKTCHKYLENGGHLRVAVPDGLFPDPSYIDAVRPNGTGHGAKGHKMLYNYQSLREVFVNAGFQVRLLEYFDESGTFRKEAWSPSDGLIRRSEKYDLRNGVDGTLKYTSIILDAVKVDCIRPERSSALRHGSNRNG